MFHGGTNFGLTNGANDKGRYLPLVTSYDYDAPLDEAGNPTEKYYALRDVIAQYAAVPDELPLPAAPAPTPEAVFTASRPLLAELPPLSGDASTPATFDALGLDSGLVLYSAPLPEGGVFEVDEVRDRAWVFVDGLRVGALARTRHERALVVPSGSRIDVLVEEQGRVNYAHRLGEPKGLIGMPRLNSAPLAEWTATPLDLARAAASAPPSGAAAPIAGPAVVRGGFTLDAAADLFLDTDGWGSGFAFVNGFLLGRYAANGPQRTLYVPAPVTRVGQNEVTVVELEQLLADRARFAPAALLGPTEE
jgi:beta-galactosidase